MTTTLGPDHPDSVAALNDLALAHQASGQIDRGLPLFLESVATARARLGTNHAETLDYMNNIAGTYQDAGRVGLALPIHQEVLTSRKAKLGPDHPDTFASMRNLVSDSRAVGRPDLASPICRELASAEGPTNRSGPIAYASSMAQLGSTLIGAKGWIEAETALREALSIREAKQPDARSTFNVRSLLGAALMGQGKPTEAEPSLRSVYEGMADRANKLPPGRPRLAEAHDRLIAWGESTGKADEVARWKTKRAKLNGPKS